ncbi:hypothetical protein ILP97_46530 [Amycolatopsis sp. H6(2020)]|nr:hypothetical protein [Amycolatopsis sp. H6(2020)]
MLSRFNHARHAAIVAAAAVVIAGASATAANAGTLTSGAAASSPGAAVAAGAQGPDVAAGKATPVSPRKLADETRLADQCTPAGLDALFEKATPLGAEAGSQYAGKKAVTCLSTSKPSADPAVAAARGKVLDAGRSQGRDSSGQQKANLPLPADCYQHVGEGWRGDRTGQCQIRDLTGDVFLKDVRTGAKIWVGQVKWLEFDYTFTTFDIDRWASQIRTAKYWGVGWGDIDAFSTVRGFSICLCDAKPVEETGFTPSSFRKDTANDASASYESTRGEPGGIGYNQTSWEYRLKVFLSDPSTPIDSPNPDVRCDNAFTDDGNDSGDPALNARATVGAGCVFYKVLPVMVYSKTGLYPTLAEHIGAAQGSGLPGAYPAGAVLNRMTDSAKRRQNGDKACPPSPTWLRPSGKSCDEYPFRSTIQGASTQQPAGSARTFAPPNTEWCEMDPAWGVPTGVVGPAGWSSCMIDKRDNSLGGSALGVFYRTNRVLDGDPFKVWIQP